MHQIVVKGLHLPGSVHPNLLPLNPLRYNPAKPAPNIKEKPMPPEAVIRSEEFLEGFCLTRTTRALTIVATDYHSRPLRLDRQQLASFDLEFKQDHHVMLQTLQEATC